MPITNWGELTKALDDPETIEEAIERLILAHDENPDAHLGANGSLLSHKVSEIIDHLAGSIIADKFGKFALEASQLDYSGQRLTADFENLANYEKHYTPSGGGAYSEGVGAVSIYSAGSENAVASFGIRCGYPSLDTRLNPFFEFYIEDTADKDMDINVYSGGYDDITYTRPLFGMRYSHTDNKIYLFVLYGTPGSVVEHKWDTGLTDYNKHFFRVEYDYDNATLSLYQDSELVLAQDISGYVQVIQGAFFMVFYQKLYVENEDDGIAISRCSFGHLLRTPV
jgi:hypothetical protein